MTGSSRNRRAVPASAADPGGRDAGNKEPSSTTGEATTNNNNDDLRLFRWKDVVIYANTGIQVKDHVRLLDQIYREWFPHRAEDKDVSDGAFWALLVRFTPPGVLRPLPGSLSDQSQGQGEQQSLVGFVGVKGLWEWHAALVEKLQGLEEEEEEEASSSGLRQTFQNVLVLIDGDWQREGVLLVWKDVETAKGYGSIAGGSSSDVEEYDAGEGWQPGCVFRCSLKRAMQITVSRDPYRTKGKSEWNELLGETLGDEDGDADGQ